jgi:hypothetical protein
MPKTTSEMIATGEHTRTQYLIRATFPDGTIRDSGPPRPRCPARGGVRSAVHAEGHQDREVPSHRHRVRYRVGAGCRR